MEFAIKSGSLSKNKAQTFAVALFEDGSLSAGAQELDANHNGLISHAIKLGDIKGKPGEIQVLVTTGHPQRIILFGLGKSGETTADQLRKSLDKLLTTVAGTRTEELLISIEGIVIENRSTSWLTQQAAELAGTACYRFNHHKSKGNEKTTELSRVCLHVAEKSAATQLKPAARMGQALIHGMDLTRDLGNQPGNVCNPAYLAEQARQLARDYPKLSVTVLDEKEMKQLGMNALLSVSHGSAQPAHLIVMEYRGRKKQVPPHILVGKGITFDTGGICLKPGPDMDQMKFDMCGAASVLGTMRTMLELEPELNVIGVIATAENMPSGTATRPGDIVTSLSGQTIEILNTDAEGRLVLCDALTYIERFKPASVVDIATLTGAVIVALGNHATGLMGNNEALIGQIKEAAETSRDRVWQLPLWDDYQQQLDSPFADMANIGGPKAGTVTAACFLSRFTKAYRWAHLDIAGTAWNANGANKGATGRPVPLLTRYLLDRAAETEQQKAHEQD
jgi:leucyl aminopeptidase